jgi:hypothetical protein
MAVMRQNLIEQLAEDILEDMRPKIERVLWEAFQGVIGTSTGAPRGGVAKARGSIQDRQSQDQSLYEFIKANPGLTSEELQQKLGMTKDVSKDLHAQFMASIKRLREIKKAVHVKGQKRTAKYYASGERASVKQARS